MLDIEKETLEKVSGKEEPGGCLSIRMPQSIGTYVLPKVLKRFQAALPRVGLDISTCAYEILIHELKTGITDLAFLMAESIAFKELRTELLAVEDLVLVSSPDHPLVKESALRIGDLCGHTILLPKHDCSYRMTFQSMLLEEKVEPAAFMEMNSVEAIKQCVQNGIGIALLPKMSVSMEIAQAKMSALKWTGENLETGILMIWHRDKWLSPILKTFDLCG